MDGENYYYDVVSLYPSVTALDKYPVGFKQFYNPTIEESLDESCIGVVKCDVIPPNTYMFLYYLKAKTETYYFI